MKQEKIVQEKKGLFGNEEYKSLLLGKYNKETSWEAAHNRFLDSSKVEMPSHLSPELKQFW